MNHVDLEDPLPKSTLTIGIIYNLKKGVKTGVIDAEAEYDSIDTVYSIQSALEAEGHHAILLEADKALPEKLRSIPIDIAFNIAEGFHGRYREAQVPAMLNFFGIPYTGSDETTLCLTLDKALTKRLLSTYRIRTPKYALFTPSSPFSKTNLRYPVIIKPNAEGSSKGISDKSIVKSRDELHALLEHNIGLYHEDMLAEEYIEGREFTVGLLGNGTDKKVFPPMEIKYKKETQEDFHVYSYSVKQNYKEYIDYQCPALLPKEKEEEMMSISGKIYDILGCKDFSRIDFRMSADGIIYFIEINPLPGLAPGYSDYPMLAKYCGICYSKLINNILQAAIIRLKKESR